MAVEFHAQLNFGSGRIKVSLPHDFFHNGLTTDPYSHSHPKYELQYIINGSCTFVLGKMEMHCPQGHFLLIPPHCIHRILPKGERVQTVSFLYSVQGGGQAAMPECHVPMLIPDDFQGQQRLMQIRQELTGRKAAYAEKIQGELTALLAEVTRRCGVQGAGGQQEPEENRAEIIEDYLAKNRFDPNCSCGELARRMHLSTRQVHRLCLQYFNAPFRELLTDMRMEIAADRLRNTDIPISALAHQLGYASIESFSAAYKRHYGRAPSAERRNHAAE